VSTEAPDLPFGAVLREDGAVELFMNAYRSVVEFDRAGSDVCAFLQAKMPPGNVKAIEFEYVGSRRVATVRIVDNPEA
jgi:hypothetical protein